MIRASSFSQTTLRTALALAFLLCAGAAYAQPQDEAFKSGQSARRDGKWPEAVTHMRRAIQIDPKEDSRKIGRVLGVGGVEYLPYYFLGEALFNAGDCAAAVEAWAVSEQQGVVKGRPEYYGLLQKGYRACETKGVLSPARYDPLLSRTRQQVTEVTSLASSISQQGQAHIDLWNANPSMREQYERASGELQNAQSRLASASRTRLEREFSDAATASERARGLFKALEVTLNNAIDFNASIARQKQEIDQLLQGADGQDKIIEGKKYLLTPALGEIRQSAMDSIAKARVQARSSTGPALAEARSLAQDAANKLRQIADELAASEKLARDKRVSEALATAQEAFSFVEGAFATLERLTLEKPSSVRPELPAQREALHKKFDTGRRRFEASRKSGNIQGIDEASRVAAEVRAELDTIIGSFGPVTLADRGVHPALQEGATLFFNGEYEKVLVALDPARGLSEIPLQLHVHVFRAAALHALYVRSGETNQSQRTQALAEIEQCKQLNPGFVPDARAFAPRFVQFFQNGGSPATPAQAPPAKQ